MRLKAVDGLLVSFTGAPRQVCEKAGNRAPEPEKVEPAVVRRADSSVMIEENLESVPKMSSFE